MNSACDSWCRSRYTCFYIMKIIMCCFLLILCYYTVNPLCQCAVCSRFCSVHNKCNPNEWTLIFIDQSSEEAVKNGGAGVFIQHTDGRLTPRSFGAEKISSNFRAGSAVQFYAVKELSWDWPAYYQRLSSSLTADLFCRDFVQCWKWTASTECEESLPWSFKSLPSHFSDSCLTVGSLGMTQNQNIDHRISSANRNNFMEIRLLEQTLCSLL